MRTQGTNNRFAERIENVWDSERDNASRLSEVELIVGQIWHQV